LAVSNEVAVIWVGFVVWWFLARDCCCRKKFRWLGMPRFRGTFTSAFLEILHHPRNEAGIVQIDLNASHGAFHFD
jgi:hypothetical protein